MQANRPSKNQLLKVQAESKKYCPASKGRRRRGSKEKQNRKQSTKYCQIDLLMMRVTEL